MSHSRTVTTKKKAISSRHDRFHYQNSFSLSLEMKYEKNNNSETIVTIQLYVLTQTVQMRTQQCPEHISGSLLLLLYTHSLAKVTPFTVYLSEKELKMTAFRRKTKAKKYRSQHSNGVTASLVVFIVFNGYTNLSRTMRAVKDRVSIIK